MFKISCLTAELLVKNYNTHDSAEKQENHSQMIGKIVLKLNML